MGEWIERERSEGTAGGLEPPEVDLVWMEDHPAIVEYLTETKWSDGRARSTATVLLFFDSGMWKVCLNDRDGERCTFVSGAGPMTALDSLEGQLQEGRVEWRPAKRFGRKS